MADFSITNAPGGALTAAGIATNDVLPIVDVSVGAADAANKTLSVSELRKTISAGKIPKKDWLNPPVAATFSTTASYNTPPAATWTDDTTNGTLMRHGSINSTSDQIYLRLKSAPSGKVITAKFRHAGVVANFTMGLCVRNSVSGKSYVIGYREGATTPSAALMTRYFNGTTVTDLTNYNIQVNNTIFDWFRIDWSDNTNMVFSVSHDGVNWFGLNSVALATQISSIDQVGFMAAGSNAGSGTTWNSNSYLGGPGMTIFYYEDTDVPAANLLLT